MVARRAYAERHDFYVYVIFRPNGIPCYVGKGHGARWQVSAKRAKNSHLRRIYEKSGLSLPIAIVRDGLSEGDAFAAEIAFIAAIGREVRGGPLVNQSDGGEGQTGYKATAETRAKQSAKLKGKTNSPAARALLSAALKGRPPSLATRLAVSAAKTGVPQTAATRAKISATLKGRPKSAEHCVAVSAARRGKPISEQAALAQAAGRRVAYAEKCKIGLKRHWWRTPTGERYMSSQSRSDQDISGSGMSLPLQMAESVRGTHWWCAPNGLVYRAVTKRAPEDSHGRGLS